MRSLTPHPVPDAVSRAFLPEGFAPEGVPAHLVHENTLRLVRCAFSPTLKIELFLACLLRYATLDPRTTMQLSLFSATGESQDIAHIFILSVEALAKSPEWRWGPETTHKILLVLEALHIIRRVFHRTYTEIHFFLGEREIPLSEILFSLQTLHDKRKNKKVRQIARKAMKRLRQQSGDFVTRSPKGTTLAHGLKLITQVISGVLRGHGVDERKDNPELIAQASLVIGHVLQPETFPLPNGRVAAQWGEFLATLSEQRRLEEAPSGEFPAKLGDSVGRDAASTSPQSPTTGGQKGDSVVDKTKESPNLFVSKREKQGSERRNLPFAGKAGDSVACETTESPASASKGRFCAESGDSVADALSSRESTYVIKESKVTEKIDIEKGTPIPARSLEDIRAEATYLWMHLYTEEQRQEERGERYVGGFITRLQDHPDLVRASMINVLMQREFPDKKFGPPKGGGSQWFYRTYKRYADGTLAIAPEIRSWLDSSYSYSQIEQALKKESERQKTDNAARQRSHLPFFGQLIRPMAEQYDVINGIALDGVHDGDETGEEEGCGSEGESSPPKCPAPSLPWTVETVFSLFAYWRGYELTGEEMAFALPFAEDIVNGIAETHREPYTRFQVEYTFLYFRSYPQLWEGKNPQEVSETGIPDIWFLATELDETWPQLRAYLLETAQYVELDGELVPYEEYQALYERAQQVAQEEKLAEAPVSFAQATQEYQRLLQSGTQPGIEALERTEPVEEDHEPMSDEGAWSLQEAQEQAAMVRGQLAGDAYAVLVATEQGGQGSLLIYARVEHQVVARLTCEKDCEQALARLRELVRSEGS